MKLKAILGVVLEKLQVGEVTNYNNVTAPIINDIVYIRAIGDGSDVENSDNTQGTVNDTDAPNDVIYMVCGVVIAMLLVGLIIVLVAVTINKLRKREETSSASPATNIEAQTTTFATSPTHRNSTSSQCSNNSSQNQQIFTASSSTTSFEANHNQNNANLTNSNLQSSVTPNGNCNGTTVTIVRQSPPSNGWVFPPKAPTPNIYNCSNNFDALVTANDKNGFKGFRKQFSGRFKRLVAKKPAEPAPAIPPELKPQLKTIYVY